MLRTITLSEIIKESPTSYCCLMLRRWAAQDRRDAASAGWDGFCRTCRCCSRDQAETWRAPVCAYVINHRDDVGVDHDRNEVRQSGVEHCRDGLRPANYLGGPQLLRPRRRLRHPAAPPHFRPRRSTSDYRRSLMGCAACHAMNQTTGSAALIDTAAKATVSNITIN